MRAALVIVIAFAAAAAVALGTSSGSRAERPNEISGAQLTRYSIVHGCYALNSTGGTPIAAIRRAVPLSGGGTRDLSPLHAGHGHYLVPGAGGDLTTAAAAEHRPPSGP